MKNHKHQYSHCMSPEFEKQHRNGRIMGGIILVLVGAAFLAKTMGVLLPVWLFSWPMIPILIGLYHLGKHGFSRPGGLIPIAIGAVFLAEKISPGMKIAHIAWPALIILFGLAMLLSPKRSWRNKQREKWSQFESGSFQTGETSDEDVIMVDIVFGGAQRNVISKNFKGGSINSVFGGAEINLLQADIQGTVTLEVSAVFGGIEIAIPSAWNVKNEITAILGGVDDKRAFTGEADTSKILILKGSAIFGGVSIKGY